MVGARAHIFLIVGHSDEIRRKVISDIQRAQFGDLLPAGVELLPYDTLLKMFSRRVPPQLHIVVPASYPVNKADSAETVLARISRVFISGAFHDSEFLHRLHHEFTRAGIAVWNYPLALGGGGSALSALRQSLAQASNFILVLSGASTHSDAVATEAMEAMKRAVRADRPFITAVAIDRSWRRTDLGEYFSQFEVLEFSDWREPKRFRALFRRLVSALQIDAA
jgi:hypothetical protein